jgi:hypothetical protein
MRFLLVILLTLLGVSYGVGQEIPKPSGEQIENASENHNPASSFEGSGQPIPFWFAPQPQTIQIVGEKKAENDCRSREDQSFRDFLSTGWCELRTYPEAITAFGTLVLALATFVLAISTQIAANAAKTAAQHIPTVERAYLFVEPNTIGIRRKDAASPIETAFVCLALSHVGNTPVFLVEVFCQFTAKKPRGRRPTYCGGVMCRPPYVLKQNETFEISEVMDSEILEPHYMCAYIEYLDIFRNKHTSRICFLIKPRLGIFEDAEVPPSWNGWD